MFQVPSPRAASRALDPSGSETGQRTRHEKLRCKGERSSRRSGEATARAEGGCVAFWQVADFGESKRFDQEQAEDEEEDAVTMTMVGTPLYAAPEVFTTGKYNTAVDVFR